MPLEGRSLDRARFEGLLARMGDAAHYEELREQVANGRGAWRKAGRSSMPPEGQSLDRARLEGLARIGDAADYEVLRLRCSKRARRVAEGGAK